MQAALLKLKIFNSDSSNPILEFAEKGGLSALKQDVEKDKKSKIKQIDSILFMILPKHLDISI